ncbi:UNKNOWN [Stylonychia lemnae]|uniref:Transmembrane protein n=1 Tax=Stylonychia lemnae TaxID=5949 RepID=A0A077ZPQ1_STYLE|nr:UNKNOWN [Stylonychia lemnae]|eukprot:CDW71942.1 UNKNOWN [Stylonychia lemnae]
MIGNDYSALYEPLIQQTQSQQIRKLTILAITIVTLIAFALAQIFGQSVQQDFLGAQTKNLAAGVSQQINAPGQNLIDIYVDKNLTIELTYKFPLSNTYSISGVQDAALDSNGIIYAIATQDLSNDQYKRFGSIAKFYSKQLYKNIEIYQDKPVLVKQNGILESFNQLCVQQISAGQNNSGGLFALSCGQQNDSLYQVMRWSKGLNKWEKIGNVLAEKIAAYSYDVVFIYRQSSIFELTIKN